MGKNLKTRIKEYFGNSGRPKQGNPDMPNSEITKISMSSSENSDFKKQYSKGNFSRIEYLYRGDNNFLRTLTAVVGCGPSDFEVLFGDNNFTFRVEYNNKCWVVDFRGKTFIIISANDRGTTLEGFGIEDISPDEPVRSNEDIQLAKSFIENLFNMLVESGSETAISWDNLLKGQ